MKPHPGKVLHDEFMKPHNMTARELGRAIDVPGNRISDILRGRRNITADTALRLGRYFSNGPWFWMNLQNEYALSVAVALDKDQEA